jgi:hypothetical protein
MIPTSDLNTKYGMEVITCNDKQIFTVYSNYITDEILNTIHFTTRIVRFSTIGVGERKLKFKVSLINWRNFVKNLTHLEFYGSLQKNQFTAKHLETALNLEFLMIGATDYLLFDNEEIPFLPKLKILNLNGFSVVQISKNMENWMKKLEANGCIISHCF